MNAANADANAVFVGDAGRSTTRGRSAESDRGPGLHEVRIIWVALALLTALLFVTYARISTRELYNVSRSGFAGGASRALVELNFPVAVAAFAIAFVLAARVRQSGALTGNRQRLALAAIVVCAVACLVIAGPKVVDQDNLDAKWINVVPALGVLGLAGVTIFLIRDSGLGPVAPFSRGDRIRIGVAIALALVALPWLFAEAGFYIGDVPGLRSIFMSRQIVAGETEVAVHLGHHHGADGLYLTLTALLLSRTLGQFRRGPLRGVFAFFLSVMVVYGLGNMVNDGWTEQIWKRGWTNDSAPSVLQPKLSLGWGVLIALAVVVDALAFRRIGQSSSPPLASVSPSQAA